MPYTHTTWTQLQTQLSLRLFDATNIFWTATEVEIWLTEALRTFGLCSGFWRERGTLNTSVNTVFYDLPTSLSNGSELILSYSVTDQDIIQQLQYALLENASSQSSWGGTEMFTFNDVANAVQNRLNQFLSDTGIVVNRSVINVISPPSGRETLSQNTIDVRRAAWIGAPPENYYVNLWREDERMLTAADQTWSVNSGTPEAYSVMAPPPLELQLSPPPVSSGQLELLTVDSAALTPSSGATVLGIPDDLTPAIKWGALSDLLGNDGIARDPIRAQFAEQRYGQYVQMARLLPVVVHTELNGVPLIPSTLQEADGENPGWQNIVANVRNPVSEVLLCSANLIGLRAVPDSAYSVTCDVVRRTPIPSSGATNVQLGREQLDMILDYAEHLALFKVGGAEWHATDKQANNFLMQSLTYNQRLSAAALASFSASLQSQRQKQGVPRRLEDPSSLGSLKGQR